MWQNRAQAIRPNGWPCGCGCEGKGERTKTMEAAAVTARQIDSMSDGDFARLLTSSRTKILRNAAEHMFMLGLRDGGSPLEPPLRRFMEQRFGHDFRFVRLHRDGPLTALATGLRLPAMAIGEHIVFGPDQYNPDDVAGRRLIAHELTHVLQQKLGRQLTMHSDHEGYLREAQAEKLAEATESADRTPADILRLTPLVPAVLSVQAANPVLVRCGSICSFPFAPEGVLIDPNNSVPCGLVDCGFTSSPGPRARSWCAYNCAGRTYGAFVINTICGPVGPYFTTQFVN
jgi:hypothetical protein